MSDGSTLLTRIAGKPVLIEGRGVRLISEPGLGISKLQILAEQREAWFEGTLDLAAPAALQEIEPGPVVCAWLAPGEWLAMGPREDVERVRLSRQPDREGPPCFRLVFNQTMAGYVERMLGATITGASV